MKDALTRGLVAGAALALLGAAVAGPATAQSPVRSAEVVVDSGSANSFGQLLYSVLSVTGSAELGRAIFDPRIGCDIAGCEPIWFGSAG
ncbi:hypothetical protein NN3_49160 [Nocardia neocaledoniensis NBRC 108232]|uniref:Uncharacterized protein n=1 Tax=Nocardia neocaledoniensis TaxID=236511 RepID=A0A317P490_9NOCA|nr:hypothetical protein [Nocardia neocaledoniensis]PWV81264.1 hypothetical protein DFR69_101604 [Nocardia neocaledoniensis]GEM33909.1 hypothetical protein NN3_49160 [Nocardia neocaledoniensis NBRC 108232]